MRLVHLDGLWSFALTRQTAALSWKRGQQNLFSKRDFPQRLCFFRTRGTVRPHTISWSGLELDAHSIGSGDSGHVIEFARPSTPVASRVAGCHCLSSNNEESESILLI